MSTETTIPETTITLAVPAAASAPAVVASVSVEAEKLRVAESMLAELQAQNKTLQASHQKALEPLKAQLKMKMESAPDDIKARFTGRDLDIDPVASMSELDAELGRFEKMQAAANAEALKTIEEYRIKVKKDFGFSLPELNALTMKSATPAAQVQAAGGKPAPVAKPGDPSDLNNLPALNLRQFAAVTADSNKMASYLDAHHKAALAAKE